MGVQQEPTEFASQSTGRRTFRSAVAWSIAASGGRFGINSLLVFILAAILGPTDFGVVALAFVYVEFLRMLLDQGFNAALIQRKNLTRLHLDSVFWMVLAASLLLAIGSVGFSGWWWRRGNEVGPARLGRRHRLKRWL